MLVSLSFLYSCVNDRDSAMGQYDYYYGLNYEGYVEGANDIMGQWSDNEYMKLVFIDSITPRILHECTFDQIVEITNIVKSDTALSSTFLHHVYDKKQIIDAFKGRSLSQACEFYADNRELFPQIDPLFLRNILPSVIKKSGLNQFIEISKILKKTPAYPVVHSYNISPDIIVKGFRDKNVYDCVSTYVNVLNMNPRIPKVFIDSIAPVIINSPYPILKEINAKVVRTPLEPLISTNISEAREEFICDVREELDYYKSQALEAYDNVVVPNIKYEIDSIAEEKAKKIQNKFSGGFLDFRKLLLMFGRNDSKFQKVWNDYVESDVFDGVFDKHIQTFLNDLYVVQSGFYQNFTGKKRPKELRWSFMSEPIILEFPQSHIDNIKIYVKDNKFSSVISILEWVPVVGDAMMLYDVTEAFSADEEALQEMDDDEKLRLLCQQLIVTQISDKYYANCRDDVLAIINASYKRLIEDIEKEL